MVLVGKVQHFKGIVRIVDLLGDIQQDFYCFVNVKFEFRTKILGCQITLLFNYTTDSKIFCIGCPPTNLIVSLQGSILFKWVCFK